MSRERHHVLYQAGSELSALVRGNTRYERIVVDWYRDGRPEKGRDYTRLIENYGDLDPTRRLFAEQFVDELFTSSEVKELRKYLLDMEERDDLRLVAQPEAAFFAHKVHTPVAPETIPFHALPVGGMTGRLSLFERRDYKLPFRVAGYFNLANRTLPEKLEESVRYIHRAMQSIGNDAGVKRAQIEEAVTMLYRRDRLFVRRDAPQMDSLEKIELLEWEEPAGRSE